MLLPFEQKKSRDDDICWMEITALIIKFVLAVTSKILGNFPQFFSRFLCEMSTRMDSRSIRYQFLRCWLHSNIVSKRKLLPMNKYSLHIKQTNAFLAYTLLFVTLFRKKNRSIITSLMVVCYLQKWSNFCILYKMMLSFDFTHIFRLTTTGV